jgi:septal ring factor EnvC (AmiA/AmiB activator)
MTLIIYTSTPIRRHSHQNMDDGLLSSAPTMDATTQSAWDEWADARILSMLEQASEALGEEVGRLQREQRTEFERLIKSLEDELTKPALEAIADETRDGLGKLERRIKSLEGEVNQLRIKVAERRGFDKATVIDLPSMSFRRNGASH